MKKRDPFSGWNCFVAVAKSGNFSRAAIELNQSVAAVSMTIKQLEQSLGVSLFHRTTRRLKLTEAGEIMYANALPALTQIETAKKSIQELNAQVQGTLRMTAPEICHRWFIQDWLHRLAQVAPNVVVDIHYSDAFEDIVTQSFDAGIRLASSVALDMIGLPVRKNLKSVLVASPQYLSQKGMPESIESLQYHDCIMLKYGQYQQIDHWQLQDEGQGVTPSIQGRYFFSSIQSVIDSALAGLGIAYVLDRSIVQKELSCGELVAIHSDWGVAQGDILLYYPKSKTPAKLRALLQVIRFDK